MVGLVLTALAAWWAARLHRAWRSEVFREDAADAIARVQDDLQSAVASVSALAGLTGPEGRVEPEEFDAFSGAVLAGHGWIGCLAWMPCLTPDQLKQFEAALHAEVRRDARSGETSSGDRPTGPSARSLYAPIARIAPADRFERLIGLDILAGDLAPAARASLERGVPTVAGPIALDWFPAPKDAHTLVLIAPRPARLDGGGGLALGIVVIEDLLQRVPTGYAHHISDIRLVPDASPGIQQPPIGPPARADLALQRKIRVAGAPLMLRAEGDPARYDAGRSAIVWTVVLLGAAVSLLGGGALGAFLARAAGARRLAAQSLELEHANASLRISEVRYRLALQAVEGIVYEWDAATQRLDRSAGTRAVVGYAPEELEPTIGAWLALVHPDDRHIAEAAARDAAIRGNQYNIEYRVRHRDGRYVEVWDRGIVVRNAAGAVERFIGCAISVAEQRRAERAAREANERFTQFADAIDDVLWTVDLDPFRVTYLNSAFERVWGVSRQAVFADHDAWLSAVHPDDRERVRDATRVWLRPDAPRDRVLEYRILRPDGQLRWIRDTAVRLDEDGRPTRVVGFAEDVTDRALAEMANRESESLYRQLFEANEAVGLIFDPADGRIVRANDAACDFYGHARESLESFTIFDLCACTPDELVEKLAGGLGSVPRLQSRHRLAGGEIRDVEIFSSTIGLQGRQLVYSIIHDTTERRIAEQALRDSQERLVATLQSLTEGCIVRGLDGGLFDCNPAAESILGVSREQLVSGTAENGGLQLLREDGSACPHDEYPSSITLRTGRPVEAAVFGIRLAGRGLRWLSINSHPLRTASGALRGAVISFTDISERRASLQAIEDTARRYELLFDANPEALWVYDIDTLRFLAINRAAIDRYQYSRDEFLSMSILDIRPPAERDNLSRSLDTPGDEERRSNIAVHRLKDGTFIDVEVISNPIEFEGRRARIVLAKDITERRRAERAVRENEARLRDAQRIGRVGDWEYDPATGAITWSEEVYRLHHRNPALSPPGLQEYVSSYLPEDRKALISAVSDAVANGREAELDVHLRLPGGVDAWHHSVINVVKGPDGHVVRVKGVVHDITDRKLAEEALRKTQFRLAAILEHLPDVVVYESDRDRLFASDNIVRLIGYPARVFENHRDAFAQLLHPADRPTIEHRIQRFLASCDRQPLVLQYRLRHAQGHTIWIEDRMILERPESGKPRIVGVFIDISQQKRAELRQRLMMAELDHRVKNNLATVISLLEQSGRSAASLPAFQKAFLGRIQALARMHRALSSSHWEGVGLMQLVRQTLEPHQSTPPGRVQIVGEDVTLPARAATPVAMALHELATNAAKYGALSTPGGHVHVQWTVSRDDPDHPRVELVWTESGGPPVSPPASPGFGTELIQGGIAYELSGDAHIEFRPEGVRCTLNVPLSLAPQPILPLFDVE